MPASCHHRRMDYDGSMLHPYVQSVLFMYTGRAMFVLDTPVPISDAPPDVTVFLSQVLELPEAMKVKALEGKKVVLLAATLRPETMYGQTNCWVLPHEKDGSEVRLHSANLARMRQLWLDYGLSLKVDVVETSGVVPSSLWLRSSARRHCTATPSAGCSRMRGTGPRCASTLPLSSELCSCTTVKARLWPWLYTLVSLNCVEKFPLGSGRQAPVRDDIRPDQLLSASACGGRFEVRRRLD